MTDRDLPGSAKRNVRPSVLCAVGSALVRRAGARLVHLADPRTDGPLVWRAGPAVDGVPRALAGCPDLDGRHHRLLVLDDAARLQAWTHRPETADAPWAAWPAEPVPGRPVALAALSRGVGHAEVLVLDEDGTVRRRVTREWQTGDWAVAGTLPGAVTLDALARADDAVELVGLTADGRLLSAVAGPAGLVGAEADGAEIGEEPAVAVTGWSVQPDVQQQALLTASGSVRQRWRSGSGGWSDWWHTDAADPLRPGGIGVGIAGEAESASEGQLLTVLDGDRLARRRWSPQQGWRPWEAPLAASVEPVEDEALTELLAPPTAPAEAATELVVPDGPVTEPSWAADPVRAESATVLFTGRELLPLEAGDPVAIGPFKLQRRVGGGQGATDKFVARDGRGYCFLKVLRDDASPDAVTAFERETRIAQRVTDRLRLTTYIDHRDADGHGPAFLALSFVPGRHLGEVVRRRPLEPDALVALARGLLEALDELAACGIVHVDLKPANVILRGDAPEGVVEPVLVDFGSAVPAGTGHIREAAFGTTGYAPPELVERQQTGPTTDVYGFGAVLVTAATGAVPADDPTARQAQLDRLPEPLRGLATAALADEPANRPDLASARKLLGRGSSEPSEGLLRRRLAVEHVSARLVPVSTAPARGLRAAERAAALTPWRYRGGLGVAAVAGIVLGLVVGTVLGTWLRML